jgi:hypothetical protein
MQLYGVGSNNAVIAEIENCELLNSQFYHTVLYSELSRNMTPSSSDLIEANTGQTNQSLSSLSPSR